MKNVIMNNFKNWRSCWIGNFYHHCAMERNKYYAYRKKYTVRGDIKHAFLRITADARYILKINGYFVSRGPARCQPEHQSYDIVDIKKYLQTGDNWVAVLVHQFGISTYQNVYRMRTGLLIDGEITDQDNNKMLIYTDPTWEIKEAEWYEPTNARYTLCLGYQERFNSAKEEKGWENPSPDEYKRWPNAWYIGPVGTQPWIGMEERGIPQLYEQEIKGKIILIGKGKNDHNYLSEDNIRLILERERDSIKYFPELFSTDRDGWIRIEQHPEEFTVIVYDFNVMTTAFPIIEVKNAKAGEIIDSFYSITLNEKGYPVLNRGFGCDNEGVCDRFITTIGDYKWEAYFPKGYQYHAVVIRAKSPIYIRIIAKQTHYPMKPKGKFISNNNILDKIWEISRTTLMCTMLDAYVDNSWREQAQWFGDGVGSFMASVYLFGDTKLFKRCLRQWSQLQLSDGSLYSLGPMDYTWHLNIVGNNFFWINGLREYYMYTGDKDLVKELSCTLKSLVNWTEINTTRDGLFLQPEGYQNFIDWTEIQTRPYSLTLNLSLLWGLKDAEYLFNELNEIEYSHKVKKMASILKKIIENRFWNNRIGAWREWVKPCKDIWEDFLNRNQPGGWANMGPYKDVSFECSQHGNALSLLLDLGNDDQKKKVKAFVQRSLEIGQTFTNTMSPSWFARVVASLFYYGDNKNAIKAIRDWYGREIDYGVTTWPEQFAIKDSEKIDVPACGNCGQAIGSSVVCLFSRYILGCYPLIPGWKEFEFYPKFGDLGKVEGIIPTIKGNIIINWEKEGNKINTIIKIPPGIKGSTRVKKKDVELLPGENKIVFVQD